VKELVRRVRERPAVTMTVVLALLALWEILTLAHVKSAAPEEVDWRSAAAFVRADFETGQDLVVFAPDWVDPVGRQWLGDLLTLADLGRMDAARYARIWEVSVRGAASGETHGAPVEAREFGAVRVRRFEQKPAAVSWAVPSEGDLQEVAHQPRRCVRNTGAHAYRGVTLGTQLQVYAGLADVWARKENRAYAKIRVLVDGAEVASGSVGNDDGWKRLAPVATTPGVHDVVLEATVDPSRGNPQKQRLDVCLAAEARTP
jgi:hypothetical protein